MITSKTLYIAISLCFLLTPAGMASWFTVTGEAAGLQDDEINSCAWGDYDNDGDMDLFAGNSQTRPGSYLYENVDGDFQDRAADAGVQFLGRNAQASAWGDCDNDGLLDLYVVAGGFGGSYENILYRNLGQEAGWTFEEITQVVGGQEDSRSAIWGDFNNDGLLDLYVANVNAECEMYKNLGGCGFYDQDCVPAENIGGAHGAVAGDIDNDGKLDIFVANVSGSDHNRLYRNYGNWIFVEEAIQSSIGIPEAICYSGSFSDYDFDGDLDLFVTARFRNYLFRNDGEDNEGIVQFVDVTTENGITDPVYSSGSAWGDFDLDGDQDLYIASINPNEFYQNRYREGEQVFLLSTYDAGVGDAAFSLSTEWADFNSDGKPDIYLGNLYLLSGQECKLYENAYSEPPQNNYLSVRLVGAESNGPGIGAHVVLRYEDDQSNPTQQMAEVAGGGSGAGSQGSLPVEFGVGQASSIDSVLVCWPSGDTSVFEDVATNQRITVVEHGTFNQHDLVWDHTIHGHYYVSGDVTVQNVELEILQGTHVYFHKTWRTNLSPKLVVSSGASLAALGTADEPIVFTSQYSSPDAGDWDGLFTMLSANSISLEFTHVSCSNYGLHGLEYLTLAPGSVDLTQCRFTSIKNAGLDLGYPSITTPTQIMNCYFEDCGAYGIRIRKDILNNDLDVSIVADTILDCNYGIYYVGNSNWGYTKKPLISNCVIVNQGPPATQTYGIFVSTFSAASPLVSPRIEADSIVGFYCGISLTNVNSNCVLMVNRVKSNSNYGLFLKHASPNVVPSLIGSPNVFNSSYVGIYCDKYSSPNVRWTKVKENQYRGVLVDATMPPDFGTSSSYGWNSIHTGFSPFPYADMEYTQLLPPLNAIGNWWGERVPDPSEIIGNISYIPALGSDPLPGYEKKEAWFVDLPEDFGLRQNSPNPFNPLTEITFYLPEACFAGLKIYNVNGQLVRVLVAAHLEAGEHSVIWDGRNSESEDVASGIYFYVLSTDRGKDSKTMTLLK